MEKTPLLRVNNLSTTIQVHQKPLKVVRSFSFDLDRGKTVALVGESGSGKTMTALSMIQLVPKELKPIYEGTVFFEGLDLLKASTKELNSIRGVQIGSIFQNPKRALDPVYTIGEQLEEVLIYHTNFGEEERKEKVVKIIERVGIPSPKERLKAYPHQLSGGMLQRVLIGMALLLNPPILIADEPTTALDVTTQAEILDLLKELQNEMGMALVLITHDMGVVAEMADDVIILYATEVVEKASSEKLFKEPLHPYTKGLLDSRLIRGKLPTPIRGSIPSPSSLPKGCHFGPRCPLQFSKCETSVPYFEKDGRSVKCWLYETPT